MITLSLTERELGWIMARLGYGTAGFRYVDDREGQELPLVVQAKMIRASGGFTLKPKANKVWEAIKAVSNG